MGNTSLVSTVASLAESDAAKLSGADAKAVASVMALWQKETASPTSANAASLAAAKAGLTASQNSLANTIMSEVATALPKTSGMVSLAAAVAPQSEAIQLAATSSAGSTTITLLQALALTIVPDLASIATGVASGEVLAFIAQTVLGVSSDILAGVSLAIPMMMPVVSWFFTAINAIGTGAFTGIVGGVGFGIGTAVIVAAVTGFASGSLINNSYVAGLLGIDTTNEANIQTLNAIDLGTGLGVAVGGGLGALVGGTIGAGITNVVSGGVGLLLGAISTIPFVGAITSPIIDVVTTLMVILGDQIGGGIGAVVGGIPTGIIGGLIGYLLQISGILPSLYEFIGSILAPVLNVTVTAPPAAAAGSITTSNVTISQGTSFSPASGFVSAEDASGNPILLTNVSVTGHVSINVPGVYYVQYTAVDPTNGKTISSFATVTVMAAKSTAAAFAKPAVQPVIANKTGFVFA
jgi:hypothetical protein